MKVDGEDTKPRLCPLVCFLTNVPCNGGTPEVSDAGLLSLLESPTCLPVLGLSW